MTRVIANVHLLVCHLSPEREDPTDEPPPPTLDRSLARMQDPIVHRSIWHCCRPAGERIRLLSPRPVDGWMAGSARIAGWVRDGSSNLWRRGRAAAAARCESDQIFAHVLWRLPAAAAAAAACIPD